MSQALAFILCISLFFKILFGKLDFDAYSMQNFLWFYWPFWLLNRVKSQLSVCPVSPAPKERLVVLMEGLLCVVNSLTYSHSGV